MSNTKKCPFCAEEIQAEAIKCKHCGESLVKATPEKFDLLHRNISPGVIIAGLAIGLFLVVAMVLSTGNRVEESKTLDRLAHDYAQVDKTISDMESNAKSSGNIALQQQVDGIKTEYEDAKREPEPEEQRRKFQHLLSDISSAEVAIRGG